MDEFIGFLVFVTLCALTSMGFGRWVKDENVSPSWIHDAELVCENNGGLKYLELDVFDHDVQCNDGASFMDSVPAEIDNK